MRMWYRDDDVSVDQRELHFGEKCDVDRLIECGVLHFKFAVEDWENNPELTKLREDRGYSYNDELLISHETMQGLDEKLKTFYTEHIHDDEEIRFVLDGRGYFEVRDPNNKWIRILVEPGDLIILPAGIYHRFTLDTENMIRIIRMFCGAPVWTAHNRPDADNRPARLNYLNAFEMV